MIARPPQVPPALWPETPYEGLVFDCDGTLAANAGALHRALSEAVEPHGIAPEASWFDARRGRTTRSLIEELAALNEVELDVTAILEDRRRHYVARISAVRAIEAVAEVVRAHSGRLPMAVASSGPADVVGATLEAIGLRSYFDAVVTIEDVSAPKPAPDVFLLAARRLGVAPQLCVAYEDTEVGAAAAGAAGMRTLLVAVEDHGDTASGPGSLNENAPATNDLRSEE